MDVVNLLFSGVKIVVVLAWIYGLLRVMGHASKWVKLGGIVVLFLIVQLFISVPIFGSPIMNDFDTGLLFQACTMTMVALGLNLIYGFNGQFSLGQFGFYGLGAYAAADITYRWDKGNAGGLFVALLAVVLMGAVILGLKRFLSRYRGIPVLSAFTLYLIGCVAACAVAYYVGDFAGQLAQPYFGTEDAPGILRSEIIMQVVFALAVLIAGLFAAESAFVFGLPVLSLGSDYFGIATLGFNIVITTLMVNTDTLLPFPEMKGGQGMIGIPRLTTWFWAFAFLLLVIVVMRNFIHSSTGRAILSVREDETAAKAMGINVADHKLLAFVMGSMFAGIGGGVYAHYIGFLSPATFNFVLGFNPLIIIVFGGLGSMTGTIAATFGWTFFLEGMLRVILGQMGTDAPTWRFVLYPITLLLMMLLRPQGLLGTVEWGFLRRLDPAADPLAKAVPAVK